MSHLLDASPPSMKKNFFWTTIGNSIYLAGQWLILTCIAKLGSVKLVGQYSLGLAITTPIIIFSQMQFRATLVTDSQNEFHFLECFWSRITLTTVGFVLIAGSLLIADHPPEMNQIIILIALAKSVESISDILHGKFQKFERMDFIAFSLIVKGILGPLLFGVIFWKTRVLTWALFGMLLVWIGTLVLVELPFSRRIIDEKPTPFSWSLGKFKKLIWLTFPISLAATLGSFSGNLPRYFLEYFQGKEGVGMFSVAAAPLIFINMLQGALGLTIQARAARHLQTNERKSLKSLLLKSACLQVLVALLFTLAFVFYGTELLSLLFSKDYTSALPALIIMSLGAAMHGLGIYGGIFMLGARMFHLQLALTIVGIIFQAIVCLVLVEKYGVWGAAWSEFLKMIFNNLLLYLVGIYAKNPFAKPAPASPDNQE